MTVECPHCHVQVGLRADPRGAIQRRLNYHRREVGKLCPGRFLYEDDAKRLLVRQEAAVCNSCGGLLNRSPLRGCMAGGTHR